MEGSPGRCDYTDKHSFITGSTRQSRTRSTSFAGLFDIIKDRQLEWDVTIKVSMLEVYNEKVRDLLADDLIMTELDHDLAGAVDLPMTS